MNAVAIIPAHNEAPRVATVVKPLLASGRFARVVVVDDGSADGTADAARAAGAHTLRLAPNRGKGGAMLAGVRATNEPVVAFFDADLVGFTPEHAGLIVDPVTAGQAAMVCGLRDYGEIYNQLQVAIPPITGERAVRRDVLEKVPDDFWQGFRIEAGINTAACRLGPVWTVILKGLKIVPKWHKVGVQQGMLDATKMAREVLVAMRDARNIAPAGQATAPTPQIDASGKIVGVDGMLNQIASALVTQARPLIVQDILPAVQNDRELQRQVGYGAGQALAGPAWLAASALALIAVAVVAKATST